MPAHRQAAAAASRLLKVDAALTADIRTATYVAPYGIAHALVRFPGCEETTLVGVTDPVSPQPGTEVQIYSPRGGSQHLAGVVPALGRGGSFPSETEIDTTAAAAPAPEGDSYLVLHYKTGQGATGDLLRVGWENSVTGNITELYAEITLPAGDLVHDPEGSTRRFWAWVIIHGHPTVPDGSFVIATVESPNVNDVVKLLLFDLEEGTWSTLVDESGGTPGDNIYPDSVMFKTSDLKVYYNHVTSVTSNVSRVDMSGTVELLNTFVDDGDPIRSITGPDAMQVLRAGGGGEG